MSEPRLQKQPSSRCSIVSRSSRRPDLPAGTRAGEVKEGRRPARRRRAVSLTGPSTVAPFLRSRPRKRLDAEHGISPGLQPFWLLSGRNATYPAVQISKASSVERGAIRMALGQLLDYRRFVEVDRCAILLPTEPREDLVRLVQSVG